MLFAGVFSSPERYREEASRASLLFLLPNRLLSPHRRHYREGEDCSLSFFSRWYLLLAGNITGRRPTVLLFNFTARPCAGTNAQLLCLSLSVGANALGHDQQYTCFNSACRKVHREHVTANGNLATFGGQPATNFGAQMWTPGSLRQMLVVLSVCPSFRDAVRMRQLPIPSLRLSRARVPVPPHHSVFLLFHGNRLISTFYPRTRHRSTLRKPRD